MSGNRTYALATAPSTAAAWAQVHSMTWVEFIECLPSFRCYVPGTVDGPVRDEGTVASRSVLTLDEDEPRQDWLPTVATVLDGAYAVHPTKRSTPVAPRYRLLVPLSRDVAPEEYWVLAEAVMDAVGWGKDRGGREHERLMYGPGDREVTVAPGDPLDVDLWLARGRAIPPRHPAGVRSRAADLDAPATEREKARALGILESAAWEVERLEDKATGGRLPGRNAALIKWLPLLYRFALGGCLDEGDVDDRLWQAVQGAPLHDGAAFSRKEFAEVSANAWGYADDDPQRPEVEEADQVFTPIPLPAALVPAPGRYVDPQVGLLTAVLADDIAGSVTYAVDARDRGQFYVYSEGRWERGGGDMLTEAVLVLLHNRFRKSHLTNVLTALGHRPGVRQIDCSPTPRWINVANGLLDWKAGELLPHTPDVLSTVQLPVRWDPEAECPAFEQFLGEVLPPDCLEPSEGGLGFIWELLGYCLYSGNPHHVAVLLFGNGRNGKGALLRVIERLVGARNLSSVPLHDLTENRFRAATLYGRLLNLAGDLDARWLANTATFKAITGGDTVQAERKYGAAFDFTPWALPVYSTNKAFGSADSSEGYLARWVVVPFPNSFLGREDRHLDERLQRREELEGVLRRAAEALPALMARGRLPEPESVRAAKHRFVTSGDALRSWLDEACVLDREAWTPRTLLWTCYEDDSEDAGGNGRYSLTKREFYNRLGQVGGVTAAMRKGTDGFKGVRFKTDEERDGEPEPVVVSPEDLSLL